jgi:hypothetical protein
MPQSIALRIVRDQVERFRTGQINSQEMWTDIQRDLSTLTGDDDGGEDQPLENHCRIIG